jgi:hypothetical protein
MRRRSKTGRNRGIVSFPARTLLVILHFPHAVSIFCSRSLSYCMPTSHGDTFCCGVPQAKSTSFEDSGGGNLIFLDRHNVDCGNNAAISEFRLIRDENQVIKGRIKRLFKIRSDLPAIVIVDILRPLFQIKYDYTCKSSARPNPMIDCEDLSTPPNEGGGGGNVIEFLDRHNVVCPASKVISFLFSFCFNWHASFSAQGISAR